MTESNKHLAQAVTQLLKPIVRLLLRSGVSFATYAEWVKQAYVAVAEKEFPAANGKQSGSRIATLTGLHRKDVARIRAEIAGKSTNESTPKANRAERVCHAWLNDAEYVNKRGKPLSISIKDYEPSFYSLVKKASGDIYPTAILDELLMAEIIEYVDETHIRLKKPGYIPAEGNTEKLKILGQSASDLLNTLDHNLKPSTSDPHLQMSVAYHHLSPKVVSEFKEFSRHEITVLMLKLNTWLAERDGTSFNETDPEERIRAGVGVYFFEDNKE